MSAVDAVPVAVRRGRFFDVYFDAERYSPADIRAMVRRNMHNCRQAGREAGAMLKQARGKLPVAELAELARHTPAEVKALERRGMPELAYLELLAEVYRPLPSPLDLLRRLFDDAGVAAAVERARGGRSFEEIEAIVSLARDVLKRLETPDAWHGVAVARDVLKALAKHGVKPPPEHKSLAAWFWGCQRFG